MGNKAFFLSGLFATAMLSACSQTAETISAAQRSPNAAIEALGYDALVLPSTAYGPGALVTSVKGSGLTSPLRLTYLCAPKFTNAPAPSVDAAASSEASREFSGSFKLDATALAGFGIGAGASDVEAVTLKFTNVKIEQLGFDELRSIRSDLGPVCRDIVAEYAGKGVAYQTKQALRADVTYTASFKRGASLEAKGVAIAALKSAFGGSVQSDSASSVTGSGLYYGLLLTKLD